MTKEALPMGNLGEHGATLIDGDTGALIPDPRDAAVRRAAVARLTAYEEAVARFAAKGFVPGARILVNGEWPATITEVTDRGLKYCMPGGGNADYGRGNSFGFLAAGTPGFDRTVVA